MLAGYYTAASGMMTRQREIDVIGNNLINMQTPGYRGEKLLTTSFEQELLTRREAMGQQVLGNGKAATAAVVSKVVSSQEGGLIKATGLSLDMAINGDGYFGIQMADGSEQFTRNGQFGIDEEGTLLLPNYGKVLDDGGREITLEDENFMVDTDGTIYDSEGEEVAVIGVFTFANEAALVKNKNGMYTPANGINKKRAEDFTLHQGNIELSNINMNQELTSLIEAQRAFQACSTALQTVDSLNRKAATQIASV